MKTKTKLIVLATSFPLIQKNIRQKLISLVNDICNNFFSKKNF